MKRVLFVCTANMCRSPMAEALLKGIVDEAGESDEWWIESAGVAALDGEPATDHTQSVVAERGLDLSRHRSRRIDREAIETFPAVLVMEERHRQTLREAFPELADRVHLLRELADGEGDVLDPVGTDIANYRRTADEILEILETALPRIRELAEE